LTSRQRESSQQSYLLSKSSIGRAQLEAAGGCQSAQLAVYHKRITPTGEPSTGANPELSVRIAQARLRAAALQHQ
jgi:hypothetical protein